MITTITERESELEAELAEQCRLSSMGAEREYVLLGKVAQLERERDAQRKVLEQAREVLNDITAEISMKRFWREKDEKRFDEIADEAITAIQEVLK